MKESSYTPQNQAEHTRYLTMLQGEFEQRLITPERSDKDRTHFDIIKAIGQGAYGEVFLVREKSALTYHAMKVVEKAMVVERQQEQHLILEKKIMAALQFPLLLALDYAFKDNVYVYFIVPFIAGGELFTYIQKYGSFADETAKFFASQMVLAVEYLHYCHVVHRDIKPENILVTPTGYIKLCDFGFCKVLKKKTWTLCGTPEYLAPEIIMSKGYSFPVDWWAVGVLIFEMCSGRPPFYASDPSKLYQKIIDAAYKFTEELSREVKTIIKGFLVVDPTKRLGSLKRGVYDIKAQNWFRNISWDQIFQQKVEAPFTPVVPTAGDTSNFPEMPEPKLKKASRCICEMEFEDF